MHTSACVAHHFQDTTVGAKSCKLLLLYTCVGLLVRVNSTIFKCSLKDNKLICEELPNKPCNSRLCTLCMF